jgi:hypothetical protein
MSTSLHESSDSPSGSAVPDNLLLNILQADVILRSCDSFEFRVPKLYIVQSSPVLGEKVLVSPGPQSNATTITSNSESDHVAIVAPLPVIPLPDSGDILLSLLSHVIPVPPIVPETIEQTMELLSVAQKYKMDVVLTRIRNHIAQQDPPFIRNDTAFRVYSLSHKYGLRMEALQAARLTLDFSPLTIQDLEDDELDMMSGASLHELWKYHERVGSDVISGLREFRLSHARKALGNPGCRSLTATSRIPTWLDNYIEFMGEYLALFDHTEFHKALSIHVYQEGKSGSIGCSPCAQISHDTLHALWEALTTVFNDSIAKASHRYNLIDQSSKRFDRLSRIFQLLKTWIRQDPKVTPRNLQKLTVR